VLALSFVLLLIVFRSLLVPLKAVLMNVLTIGAAYGIVVAVFQWGWAGGLIGIEGGPINPFIPMMLFAVVFGLSMDYEVLLLSRIREEYLRTGDANTSVADGVASTARVITAAAAIMVVVFASFTLEDMRELKISVSVSPSPCSSMRRSSAWWSSRPPWSSSATATGGSRSGSTGSCRTWRSSPPSQPFRLGMSS
jgi:hypothetical protein